MSGIASPLLTMEGIWDGEESATTIWSGSKRMNSLAGVHAVLEGYLLSPLVTIALALHSVTYLS